MKKLLFTLIALVVITGCSKTDEEKITDLYNTGLSQIQDYQYSQAENSFSKILEINTGAIEGILGQALLKESRLLYYDAIYDFIIVLGLSTDHEDAYQGLYRCYRNVEAYEKAFEIAVTYQKRWKDNPESKFLLAEAVYNLEQYSRARSLYSQAIEEGISYPDACKFGIAATFVKQGLSDSANSILRDVNVTSNNTTEFYNANALYQEAVGAVNQAIAMSTEYYESDRTNISNSFIHFNRCLKYDYLFNAREVMSYLEEQKVDSQVVKGFKLFYALHVDAKDLIRRYGQEFHALVPGTVTGVLYSMKSRGALSDKLSLTQDMLKVEGDINNGEYGAEFGQFYLYTINMLYTDYEKSPPTLTQLDRIPGMWRNNMDFKLRVALIKHVVGLFDESYNDLNRMEEGHKTQADWLSGIADIWGHYGIRKYDKAAELYNEALTINPFYLPAFQKYLKMLHRINEYDQILALYEKYPQFEKNEYINLQKAKYLFLNNKFEDGMNQFKQYFESATGNFVFVEELYDILVNNKRSNEINQLTEILQDAVVDNPDGKVLLAKMAHDRNDNTASLSLVDEALVIEPDFADAHIQRAKSLYHAGSKTEAFDLFEENLVRFMNNPTNLLYYSQILAEEGIDFDKAANIARQATFHGYGRFKYVMSLSDIYYKMGRYDLSSGEAKKACNAARENPYPYFRYGMALYMNGVKEKQKEAKKQLQHALDLGLSGSLQDEAKNIISKL